MRTNRGSRSIRSDMREAYCGNRLTTPCSLRGNFDEGVRQNFIVEDTPDFAVRCAAQLLRKPLCGDQCIYIPFPLRSKTDLYLSVFVCW
jgi:hypothetical protein